MAASPLSRRIEKLRDLAQAGGDMPSALFFAGLLVPVRLMNDDAEAEANLWLALGDGREAGGK